MDRRSAVGLERVKDRLDHVRGAAAAAGSDSAASTVSISKMRRTCVSMRRASANRPPPATPRPVAQARTRAGIRARPSARRRSWRAWTASSTRSHARGQSWSATCPAVIASPSASAASTEALVTPGAVRRGERAAGVLVRRAGALRVAVAVGLDAVRRAALRAGGLWAGALEERGSSAASAWRRRSASPASWSRRS
jgi:hypothetical protein